MAALSEKSIKCAICSEPLKDPLALPCGHSYCRDCIERLFRLPRPEPISRPDFLRYARDIAVDPNTVNPCLALSDENRKLTRLSEPQSYPDHPDRFDVYLNTLSQEPLTGRCYWELEWEKLTGIQIAVSYKDIPRKTIRTHCRFGSNDKSWGLECRHFYPEYQFSFNSVLYEFSAPIPERFGVYLDHDAGVLAFYSVEDQTMTLLHRVQTTFTKPLYAGVAVLKGSAHFPKLK